jgi:hypothetical protein
VASRERHTKYKRKRREKVLREGLCTQCAKPGRASGRLYCQDCLDAVKAKKYGITVEEIRALPSACEICGSTRNRYIDHDHEDGFVRGRLCRLCNTGLGMFRDSPEFLTNAAAYLSKRREAESKPAPLRLVAQTRGSGT